MSFSKRILMLSAVLWSVALAAVSPDWVQNVEAPRRDRNFTLTTTPEMPELYGYQVVLHVKLPKLSQPATLEIKVNGEALSPVDAESVSRVRTPDAVRFTKEGTLEIQPGAADRIMEISLAGTLSATANNAIEFTETLNGADKKAKTLLANAKLLMRPEGVPAAQLPPPVENGALTIVPGAGINILYCGKPFIGNDEMIGLGALAKLKAESKQLQDENGKLVAENILLHHEIADFRREAALDEAGALELSIRTVYKKEYPGNYEWYSFAVPAELLEGAKWETRSGSAGGFDIKRGTLKLAALAENAKVFEHAEIRFLHLEKGDMKLNFDFNPYGSGDWYSKVPYGGNPIGIVTHVNKVGNTVRFYITKRPGADRYAAKVRIYAGDNDFAFRHYNNAATYYVGPFIGNPGLRLLFGSVDSAAMRNADLPKSSRNDLFGIVPFQSMEKNAYLPLLAAGWKRCPDNVQSYYETGFFPIASGLAAHGGADAEFVIPALSGVYSLQLIMGHPAMAQGPFTVTVNGEVLADNVTVQPGEYRQLFAAIYLKNPVREAKLTVSGKNWSLNQLIWRNAASEAEDFCVARNFWRVPGMADFGRRVDVWQTVPVKKVKVPVVLGKELTPGWKVRPALAGRAPEQAQDHVPPLPEDDPALDWVWNLNMTHLSLGLGNAESGFGFTDETFLRTRLLELKQKGFNAFTEQGLFWHTSYDDETFQGLIEHQKRVNAIAHEYGIKVIRHTDGPSFSLMADGLANFARFPGAFGQHLDTMQTMQGIGCINNPLLRKWVIQRIGDYVAATDADGVMVDECIIAERPQCGCVHCRRKFLADTGCILPMPGDKSVDFSDQSSLHARFVEWKLRCNGEFFRDLKAYLNKVRPGTLVTSYDIDRELADGGGRTGYRADFFAPMTDFFGSEPCSINLFVNYRCYLVMRKIMLAFSRETGHPVWTLIYNWGMRDASQAGLLGWLLATPTSHSLWMGHDMAHPVMAWQGAMDRRHKESLADVAILYRPDARSFVGYGKYMPYMEAGGISQSLGDHHITHDFITQRDLLREPVLKCYKVLMLGNINVLSYAELQALTKWVQNGGKLIISGTFAGVDETYQTASAQRRIELTGVTSSNEFKALESETVLLDGETLTLPERIVPMQVTNADVMLTRSGKEPLLARRKLGQGEVWTSAIPLGENNFEPLFYYAQRYTYKFNEELDKLAVAILRKAHPEAFRTAVTGDIPKEQRVEFYRDKLSGDVYAHCVNLSGSNRAEEGKVPVNSKLPDDAFKRATDMTLAVEGEFACVTATSPDFTGELKLESKVEDARTVVTLPGKDLEHYTLVVFRKTQEKQ